MIKLKQLWRRMIKVLSNNRAEGSLEWLDRKSSYREVKIGKVLYKLTSIFEGKKDIDKVVERIAIKNAINESERNKNTV